MVDPVMVLIFQGPMPEAIEFVRRSTSSVFRDESADTQLNNVVQVEVLSDDLKRFLIRGPL
jgi:hypothetical protein